MEKKQQDGRFQPTMSTIKTNVNGSNTPTKMQRLSEWIKKQNSTVYCMEEIHCKYKGTVG